MRRILYDYPFLFVFLSVAAFAFYKSGSAVFLLFLLISLAGLLRFKVFIVSVLSVFILWFSSQSFYKSRAADTKTTLKGSVYDIRQSKHLSYYVKTEFGKIYLFVPKIYDNINIYDHISFKAKLKPVKPLKNSGFKRYLYSNNILFIGYARYVKKIKGNIFLSSVQHIRAGIEREFYYFLKQDEYIFLQNAIFGDSVNKYAIKNIFIDTQTAHIMSVSGLHMGFVFGLFYFIFYRLFSCIGFIYKRFNLKTISSTVSFLPTLIYFGISGMHIPAMRSFLMVFVFIFALIYGYRKNSYNILFFVASFLVVLLGYKTVFNPSFVMSFFMSFVAIYLYGFVKKFNANKIITYTLFSFLISIFAMPLSSFYFNKLAYLSFLSNFIVVPYFGFVVMPLSFISIVASFLPVFAVKSIVFSILSFAVSHMLDAVEIFSHIKPIEVHVSIWVVVAIYCFLFLLFNRYQMVRDRPQLHPSSAR